MNLKQYRQRYADLYDKVKFAQNELDCEVASTKDDFNELYQRQKNIDRQWFAANLNYILKHKKPFQSYLGLGGIVIDFLNLYYGAYMVAGVAFDVGAEFRNFKILVKDLLTLWDEGFTYQGFPIIGYEKYIHWGEKIRITYIENGSIKEVSTDFMKEKNPLELPKEIVQKVKKANVSLKYPDWQTYKTIDLVRNVLDKKESAGK